MGEAALNTCFLCHSPAQEVFLKGADYRYLRCRDCGLVRLEAMPSRSELKGLYDQPDYFLEEQEDGTGADFIGEEQLYFSRFQERLRSIEKRIGMGRILDIGASVGQFLFLAKRNGWDIYGLEISKNAVAIAKDRYGVKIETGLLDNVVFQKDFFDVITLWHTFEHFSDPLSSLGSIAALLKKSGLLVLELPNIDSQEAKQEGEGWRFLKPKEHLFQYTPKTVTEMLQRSGFSVEAIEYEKGGTGLGKKMEKAGFGFLRHFIAHHRIGLWLKRMILSLAGNRGSREMMLVFARKI